MLKNQAQYDYVKNILVERMSGYRRKSFKLQRLHEIIADTVETQAYIHLEYPEFRDMFVKECIVNKIPDHTFTIAEEGYLDKRQRYPYAEILVDYRYVPKRKRRNVAASTATC